MSEPQFGWIPPSDEKRAQNMRYSLSNIYAEPPLTVEYQFDVPPYVAHYDQVSGSCTGYSSSWMTSIYNKKKYDGMWLYRRGQDTDNDPNTERDPDGGHIWAVLDVLRKEGHVISGEKTPTKAEGIDSYYWCLNSDQVRTAVNLKRVPVFGFFWFQEFNSPRTINGEFWIGSRAKWGGVLGGHAICCVAASDQRQAFKLVNSWGASYPQVWISYASINRLLGLGGECAIALDLPSEPTPPPPPPPPAEKKLVEIRADGKVYAGELGRL
jgi:hypothetical protein